MKLVNHIQRSFVTFGFQNKLDNHNHQHRRNHKIRDKHSNNKNKKLGGISTRVRKPSNSIPSSSSYSDSLFQRIQAVRDPKASVLPILVQWVGQGRAVSREELAWIVRAMRDFKRFAHALQISQWMSDNLFIKILPKDAAMRLDLIHRVHGLEYVENYFNALSPKLKTYIVHSSLLRSYVRENLVEKAESVMNNMRNMDAKEYSSFPYNMLINLYARNEKYDKIDDLMQEMERNGIHHDRYTLRNRMSAYIAEKNLLGMEKILRVLEKDSKVFDYWKVLSLGASGYIKLGSNYRALKMLSKLEYEVSTLSPESRKTAFMFLLTLYSSLGEKDELLRVWDRYKPSKGVFVNGTYSCMIRSLMKLGDIEQAERVFEEWELKCTDYDFRVVNSILVAYCKKGLMEKAESVLEKAIEGGKFSRNPYSSSWNILANGYSESGDLARAVEMLNRGLVNDRKGWVPNMVTLSSCLDYLKEKGDVVGMEKMVSLVRDLGVLGSDKDRRLLRACNVEGESFFEALCEIVNGGEVVNQIDSMYENNKLF